MTIGNLVRNAVQHGTGGEVLCRSHGHELVVTNAGTLPTENLSSRAATLYDAPRRPRHGPVPGAADLRALRLGHQAGKRAARGHCAAWDLPRNLLAIPPPEIPPPSRPTEPLPDVDRSQAQRARTGAEDHDCQRQARGARSADRPVHRRRRHRPGYLARFGARDGRGRAEGLRRQAQDPLDGGLRRPEVERPLSTPGCRTRPSRRAANTWCRSRVRSPRRSAAASAR